jgi:hypothetical protein
VLTWVSIGLASAFGLVRDWAQFAAGIAGTGCGLAAFQPRMAEHHTGKSGGETNGDESRVSADGMPERKRRKCFIVNERGVRSEFV